MKKRTLIKPQYDLIVLYLRKEEIDTSKGEKVIAEAAKYALEHKACIAVPDSIDLSRFPRPVWYYSGKTLEKFLSFFNTNVINEAGFNRIALISTKENEEHLRLPLRKLSEEEAKKVRFTKYK